MCRDQGRRDQTRRWFWVPIVTTARLPADWRGEPILIDGLQSSAETGVGGSPSGMLQIVAATVYGTVLGVVAHVRTVLPTSVARAAG